MRVLIDISQLALDKELGKMVETTKKGAQDAAEKIRDEARDNYVKMVHQTQYGEHSTIDAASSSRSLKHAIVVRPNKDRSEFEVGPKRGGMSTGAKVTSYEEILGYVHEGTGMGRDKGWAFKLPEGRDAASKSGFWFTKGQDPKPFMAKTSEKVSTSQWNRIVEVSVSTRLKEVFK